jgi:hypothetical protein
MKNRLILDFMASWDRITSPVLNVTKDNTDTQKMSLSSDYELSQNLRVKFGFSGTIFANRELKDDDYIEYAGNAGLTIQF